MKLKIITKHRSAPTIQFVSDKHGNITGGVFVAAREKHHTIRWTIDLPDQFDNSTIPF